MQMQSKIVVGAMLAAALTGCVTVPQEQIAAADIGPVPDAERIVRAHLESTLKDPDSIKQLQVSTPERCANRRASWKPEFGWCLQFSYNAKNSYGGYIGVSSHSMMIQNGKVLMEDGRFIDGWAFEQ